MRPDGSARKAIVRNVRDLDSDSSPEPVWAPSGREIAYVRTVGVERERRSAHFFRHAIYVVRRDGSDLRRVTTTPFINNVFGEIPVAWSPESRSLAFIDPRGVATVRVGVNRVRRLTRSRKFGLAQAGISWAPSTRLVFASKYHIYTLVPGRTPLQVFP
jgi:Tol biopolymer transport system component